MASHDSVADDNVRGTPIGDVDPRSRVGSSDYLLVLRLLVVPFPLLAACFLGGSRVVLSGDNHGSDDTGSGRCFATLGKWMTSV